MTDAQSGAATVSLESTRESISARVQKCDNAFEQFCSVKPESTTFEKLGFQQLDAVDQFDRFKIWSGNIAAHRNGRSSLDYRLREASQLKELIIDYLTDLEEALSEAMAIIKGEQEPWEATEDDDEMCADDTELEADTEMQQIVAQIKGTITCLMRLSMTIRDPVSEDLILESFDFEVPFHAYDAKHVHEKFPKAEDYLAERLGHGISQRRQMLKKWNDRHERLSRRNPAEHTEARTEVKTQVNTETVATSLPSQLKQMTFQKGGFDDGNDSDTNITLTTYASTMNSNRSLRPPSFPADAEYGVPFECFICFRITSVNNYDSWKKHVYRDLHPYLCTVKNCQMPNRLFNSQHSWFEHEVTMHRGPWKCLLGCDQMFYSRSDMAEHITSAHLEAIGDTDAIDIVESMRLQNDVQSSTPCPLCGQPHDSFRQLQRHLGRHQQELALFALPSRVAEDGPSDSEDSEDGSGLDAENLNQDPDDEYPDASEIDGLDQNSVIDQSLSEEHVHGPRTETFESLVSESSYHNDDSGTYGETTERVGSGFGIQSAPMPKTSYLSPMSNHLDPGSASVPDTTTVTVRQNQDDLQWIAFECSPYGTKMEYTIRCDVESVAMDELSPEFKTANCVYHRPHSSRTEYKAERLRYESEYNALGWALAVLNPGLRGKPDLIQCAVDSWRTRNQDPRLRSKRVRRQTGDRVFTTDADAEEVAGEIVAEEEQKRKVEEERLVNENDDTKATSSLGQNAKFHGTEDELRSKQALRNTSLADVQNEAQSSRWATRHDDLERRLAHDRHLRIGTVSAAGSGLTQEAITIEPEELQAENTQDSSEDYLDEEDYSNEDEDVEVDLITSGRRSKVRARHRQKNGPGKRAWQTLRTSNPSTGQAPARGIARNDTAPSATTAQTDNKKVPEAKAGAFEPVQKKLEKYNPATEEYEDSPSSSEDDLRKDQKQTRKSPKPPQNVPAFTRWTPPGERPRRT